MHPRNKLRLMAGIVIDPLLEKAGCYTKDIKGNKKADYPGKVDGKNDKKSKKYGYDMRDAGLDTGGDAMGEAIEATPVSSEPVGGNTKMSQNFKDGDIVIVDDGIYIVVLADPQADMVGIIPAGLAAASADEKNRAVQMVKPDKVRKPTEEERDVMRKSDQELATVDDDMAPEFSAESVKDYDPAYGKEDEAEEMRKHSKELNKPDSENVKKKKTKEELKEGMRQMMSRAMKGKKYPMKDVKNIKKTSNSLNNAIKNGRVKTSSEEEERKVSESTLNYRGNQLSHKDVESDPINIVGQGEKNWANSLNSKKVKNEYALQVDNRDKQSANEEDDKIKVPANIKKGLKDAINTFKNDAAKQGNTHTARENAQMFMDTAEAFEKLLDLLNMGTIMGMKKAQIFASSLMGPMLHKLPDGCWDFIVNGGTKKSLKDYMNKVGDKK